MKKIILSISLFVIILSIIFLAGCKQSIVCEAPYIRYGSGCCLDQNENAICDNDEIVEEVPEEPEEIEEVFCDFNTKYLVNEDGTLPCECKDSIIYYKSCPGQDAEINKYVFFNEYFKCIKYSSWSTTDEDGEYVTGMVLVSFKEDVTYSEAKSLVEKYNGEITEPSKCRWVYGESVSTPYHMVHVLVDEGKEKVFIANIEQEDAVSLADLNYIVGTT